MPQGRRKTGPSSCPHPGGVTPGADRGNGRADKGGGRPGEPVLGKGASTCTASEGSRADARAPPFAEGRRSSAGIRRCARRRQTLTRSCPGKRTGRAVSPCEKRSNTPGLRVGTGSSTSSRGKRRPRRRQRSSSSSSTGSGCSCHIEAPSRDECDSKGGRRIGVPATGAALAGGGLSKNAHRACITVTSQTWPTADLRFLSGAP